MNVGYLPQHLVDTSGCLVPDLFSEARHPAHYYSSTPEYACEIGSFYGIVEEFCATVTSGEQMLATIRRISLLRTPEQNFAWPSPQRSHSTTSKHDESERHMVDILSSKTCSVSCVRIGGLAVTH